MSKIVLRKIQISRKEIIDLEMNVKESKQSFKCDICEYSFSSRGSLIRHVRSIHEGRQRQKTLKCEICNVTKASKQTLNRHIA